MKTTLIKGEQYEASRQKGLLDLKRKVISYISQNNLTEQKVAK